MLTIRRLFITLVLFATLLGVAGCAKQGFPSGGPKDQTPPVVTGTEPANGTTHFDTKEFVIHFDEYVTVKDAENNILVSPPMKHKPEYKTKGRGIVVKIKDTLRENTTYLFQFKEAIADFNEGNALPSFEYVFSTGGSIDSMTLRGSVLDAFTRKPRTETVTVMAYAESQITEYNSQKGDSAAHHSPDSIVAKVGPLYATRCDKEGRFALNHLREGRYMLFAIEDGDKNLRLNGDEAAAFLDSLVVAEKMPTPPDTTAKDTTVKDTTALPSDTATMQPAADSATAHTEASADSTLATQSLVTDHLLLMSQDKKEVQRVTKSGFVGKSRIQIVTQSPLSRHYRLLQLTADSTAPRLQLYHQPNPKGDTLTVWVGTAKCDSITLLLSDSTGLNDTLRLQYKETDKPLMGMKAPPQAKPRIIQSLVAANHPYFDTLWLKFANPVDGSCAKAADTAALDTAVLVTTLSDSSHSRCGIRLLRDSAFAPAAGIKAYIDFTGKPGEKYQFSIPEGLFCDIYQNRSDSVGIATEFTKTESYGNIVLTIESGTDSILTPPLILQLTNEKGDMLREQVVTRPGKHSFTHLKGGKYGFRAIVDSNGDGRWTPGNYWQHRQPEKILFFEKTLELRENWDMEEKWNLDSNP